MRDKLFIGFSLLILCFAFGFNPARAQTTAFTYQGNLTDMSAPANGNYDFMFTLYDAAAGGTQIGPGAFSDDVQVSGGIFTVNLDFGASAFTGGAARFLETSVRPGASMGAFTTLLPRQEITSAPFAVQTLKATSADSLSNLCVLCITNAQIQSIDGSKVSGNVANATNATSAMIAGNVSGIVQITNGGTGSSAKSFVDLSTTQLNIGGDKTFTGVLSGNGSGLINIPGTLRWQTVAGLSQQAQPNNGYLTTHNVQATITLPTGPSVGDVVRVSGTGLAGWKIAFNSGQSLASWVSATLQLTPRETNRNWISVASSVDGAKLAAATASSQIFTSPDSGVNWLPRISGFWTSVASSANGTKLVVVWNNGMIYTSTDSGANWTARESNRNWSSVASSQDGTKLIAAAGYGGTGRLYTSGDSGVTWTPRADTRTWWSVASSADGTNLIAAEIANGTQSIHTSNDSGVTWTPRTVAQQTWRGVASSADGTKLVAVGASSQIFISTNSGTTWTPRGNVQDWRAVACSLDCSVIAAASNPKLQVSSDGGLTWTDRDINRDWNSVALSADGAKLVATVNNGQIYIGIGGLILSGGQYSSIELLYIGNGLFVPISYSGTISGI